MLELSDVRVDYGAAAALSHITLVIGAGELVCVVGPNGAGKTTLINAIAGLHRVKSGRMTLDGRDIARLPPHRYCSAGIALVPEGRRLFGTMTVRENLELGAFGRQARAARARSLAQVCTMFPAVGERLDRIAGTLSGGQQQMVAIGRALMACPRLLLLDEPSLGLAPVIVGDLFRAIRSIHAAGTAVLLVEQNVTMALDLATRAYVLDEGRIVTSGAPDVIAADPALRRAYLGVAAE
ncbi:MAG TPA: ABC transporter ATP-binding protein [Casimicrobiaceae bacterium]|nr:ABC transporter ATP-binding protein [Casimicrobiaceae bacterium]